ncbi:hypothetical protein POV27_15440 [Aureisphaera galaxeae]|uniref:hypothetical protein n=1 Tax=Aureisphaera galaxeae TaxID=1538023 RepID=UPI0023508004|nr:hypothetical protein [Aureisphaera galaxeae]MDC8005451.1 hypothetical protein [Aureisphaera galaxeae]
MGIISKVIIISGLFVGALANAQAEKVIISEKKTGKRLVLMAENKTADTLNVFLMVHAEGYRRSADKPVLKDIPPRTKVPMITLIELKDIPSNYTYDLIVNDELDNDIHVTQEKEVVDIENAVRGKVVVFRMTNCEKCDALATQLQSKRIQHRVFNIETDGALYAQFMAFIDKELTSATRIRFPVIWNKSYTIFGYDELEAVLAKLEN